MTETKAHTPFVATKVQLYPSYTTYLRPAWRLGILRKCSGLHPQMDEQGYIAFTGVHSCSFPLVSASICDLKKI